MTLSAMVGIVFSNALHHKKKGFYNGVVEQKGLLLMKAPSFSNNSFIALQENRCLFSLFSILGFHENFLSRTGPKYLPNLQAGDHRLPSVEVVPLGPCIY